MSFCTSASLVRLGAHRGVEAESCFQVCPLCPAQSLAWLRVLGEKEMNHKYIHSLVHLCNKYLIASFEAGIQQGKKKDIWLYI